MANILIGPLNYQFYHNRPQTTKINLEQLKSWQLFTFSHNTLSLTLHILSHYTFSHITHALTLHILLHYALSYILHYLTLHSWFPPQTFTQITSRLIPVSLALLLFVKILEL